MSTGRALVILIAAAFAVAGVVALAARTPAAIREAKPGKQATDPALGARFTDEQVARHGRFRAPNYLAFALSTALEIIVLIVLARGPFARLVAWTERLPGGWALRAAFLGAAIAVSLALITLPLGYVRGFAMQHAWGLSTQDLGGWLSDRAKGLAIGAVIAAIIAVAFFGIVRWQPRTWWLWGWAAFTLLTAAFTVLWPVVIAPLFNRDRKSVV